MLMHEFRCRKYGATSEEPVKRVDQGSLVSRVRTTDNPRRVRPWSARTLLAPE